MLELRDINLIIFPDWQQGEESLKEQLTTALKVIGNHPDAFLMALVIDCSDTEGVRAKKIIEEITNLETNLSIVAINILEQLSPQDWESLTQQIHAHLVLPVDHPKTKDSTLPFCDLESFAELRSGHFFLGLGRQLFQLKQWEGAAFQYEKLVRGDVTVDRETYWELSQCYRTLQSMDAYEKTLQEAISLYPQEGRFYFSLIFDLQHQGRTPEAIKYVDRAYENLPEDYTFKILKSLLIPMLYEQSEDIYIYRQRYLKGLQELIGTTDLSTPAARQNALAGISRVTNFYLPYQAKNDIELQRQYGTLVTRIMGANYPQWSQPLANLPVKGKIKVGYVSAYLHSYSGTLWLLGWLKYANKADFEIYCYYTGDTPDQITEQFKAYSDQFYQITSSLEAVCQQIRQDQLHILVYPELGMDAPTLARAGLRLAPIQCVAWGHPVTTGLPTIDYFLSGALMEPEDAQEHYTEKLILLPNIGVSYPRPYIPPLTTSRVDYSLPEDAVIYLCCQAPFKYLPDYDYLFPEIAQDVPDAKFIFLRGKLLKERLDRAFREVGLNYRDYCLFGWIPDRADYLAINLLADIYLDTITWSGGNTSLEAIACHLPIVTYRGEFMRGRHTESFLKMIDVTDTIARNDVEYASIAIELGLDIQWRQEIKQLMRERSALLYEDRACVQGLEEFYRQVVTPRVN